MESNSLENCYYLTKKEPGSKEAFDVTMRSFDGAEICEIVGIYLLEKLSPLLGKENFGLNRDDVQG